MAKAMRGEHFDVLIIGGGISGIGAACHLHQKMPHLSYVILEARPSLGGTWDFYKFPGVRTDSDMFTMAYSFNPWKDIKTTASAGNVLSYMLETASKHNVQKNVRLNEKVLKARWDTPSNRWSIDVKKSAGEEYTLSGTFIFMCAGFSNFNELYSPTFNDSEKFAGKIVHPQTWPTDLDYSGKEIVVIGSGATAITIVPELAKTAAHVTMLQRSPSYILQLPNVDPLAWFCSKFLPLWWTHFIMRAWNIFQQQMVYIFSRSYNGELKKYLKHEIKVQLGERYESKHFSPPYNVLEQRLCLSPDNDFTESINKHGVTIVTDTIERFSKDGVVTTSGQELKADIIVTATGFNLSALGCVAIEIDGVPLPDLPSTCMYKGSNTLLLFRVFNGCFIFCM